MADGPNFLLGYGEKLTRPIPPIGGGRTPKPPYTFLQARDRLIPMVQSTAMALEELPDGACPNDLAVAKITMHPQYIAKSYHPQALLDEVGLRSVGSRPGTIKPDRLRKGLRPPDDEPPRPTTEIFVAGHRTDFLRWGSALPLWGPERRGSKLLPHLEQIGVATPAERLIPFPSEQAELTLEVALHIPKDWWFILDAFISYLGKFDLSAEPSKGFLAGGLFFLPLLTPAQLIPEVLKFSFLRVARAMPGLRHLPTITRSLPIDEPFTLPDEDPMDPMLSAAVFDGGIAEDSTLRRWVDRLDGPGVKEPVASYEAHGEAVSSALLFGPIRDGASIARPYSKVAHFRVLDHTSHHDPDELYAVLRRIENVVEANRYEFINLSIGPDLPVEDKEVHAWTAVLDSLFHRKGILVTVAAGNSGDCDRPSGNARIQVPSDCVNALTVGACDRAGEQWRRADYSSYGPGRSPGLIKPDILSFGGSDDEPFRVYSTNGGGKLLAIVGTSFASPYALRTALGIRAHFGQNLSPLAIKTLLIHSASDSGHPKDEVGWGRIPSDLEELVVCPEGVARIVYQGELEAGQFLRAQIPVPNEELHGFVTIAATFCYTTPTDPQDPGNYTRSGLRVIFRPNEERREDDAVYAKPASFFSQSEYESEQELRSDAHKWETVLNRTKRMRGSSLKNPVFDIHHNARVAGAPGNGETLRYALVVTVSCKSAPDLYNQIVRRYRTQLRPLQPQVQIPIRTRG